jgi:hypothetical protein
MWLSYQAAARILAVCIGWRDVFRITPCATFARTLPQKMHPKVVV